MIKFRHYEKATFEKNLPLVSTKQLFLLSSVKISGDFFKSFWPFQKSWTYVVGMSIETLFDMWRNDEILNFHETYFLKYKTETAKTVQRQLHILHNISKFRHFVTYQITFLLTCQPQKWPNRLFFWKHQFIYFHYWELLTRFLT